MASLPTIIPVIGRIHFDDIAQQFRIVATFELKTPVGNYRKQIEASASDLAAAINELLLAWTGAGQRDVGVNLGFSLGAPDEITATLTAAATAGVEIPEIPEPPAGLLDTPDDPTPADTYVPPEP